MKKILSFILLSNLLSIPSINVDTSIKELCINSESAVLLDFNSGEMLYEKNSHTKLKPASMTKMMGLYLVMKSINNNLIKLDDKVKCSLEASQIGGSQIYLKENEEMTIDDLIKSVCIASANDAMYLLGETVSGLNDSFVSLMNETAKQFELKNTNFTNVMGFDDENHYSTSFDMGIIAHNLLKSHSDLILKYTSMTEDYLRKDTNNPFWLVNTNKLLGDYEGMDGLKTGYTHQAGYCLTATSNRNNLRLIAVTMNAKTIKDRSNDIKSLLNYGYSNYKSIKVFSKDEKFMSLSFNNSKNEVDNIYIKDDIYITLPINEKNDEFEYTYTIFENNAPISKDEVIGQIEIYNSTGMIFYGDLVLKEDIKLIKWYEYFLRVLKSLII